MTPGARISHTSVMATGLKVGGDVDGQVASELRPRHDGSRPVDQPGAERLVGDVRGRHFTSVVAPEDRPRARELPRPCVDQTEFP